jgi:hypothetical protein
MRPLRDNVAEPGYYHRYVTREVRAALAALNHEDYCLYDRLSVPIKTTDGYVSSI